MGPDYVEAHPPRFVVEGEIKPRNFRRGEVEPPHLRRTINEAAPAPRISVSELLEDASGVSQAETAARDRGSGAWPDAFSKLGVQ
jgi:hypothetical protein